MHLAPDISTGLYGLTREQFDTAKAGGGTDEQRRLVVKKSADSSKSGTQTSLTCTHESS
jgi:hypothetical protein